MSLFQQFSLGFLLILFALPAAAARPNIILLVSDDQGYGDMGRHGHPFLKTPHMDRLHDGSVRMTDFSVSPHLCADAGGVVDGNAGVQFQDGFDQGNLIARQFPVS